jgi:hypothetical protein
MKDTMQGYGLGFQNEDNLQMHLNSKYTSASGLARYLETSSYTRAPILNYETILCMAHECDLQHHQMARPVTCCSRSFRTRQRLKGHPRSQPITLETACPLPDRRYC